MKKIKLILVVLTFVSSLHSQNTFDVVPYYVPIFYSDSEFRENSFVVGSYFGYQAGINDKFEAAVDYSQLKYINDVSFDQYDFTFIYKNFSIREWELKLGGHYIKADDAQSDGSFALIGGLHRYRFNKFRFGLDTYYSFYNNYSPELKIFQITPALRLTFAKSRLQGIYLESKVYYILLNEQLTFDSDAMLSFEQSVTYYTPKYSLKFYGWIGEQLFALRENGFVMNNVVELHKGGLGSTLTFFPSEKFSVKFGGSLEFFEDIGLTNEAKAVKLILGLGKSF